MTTYYKPWMCGGCGYMMDAASHLRQPGLKPNEDDLSLCLNCGVLYQLRRGVWMLMATAERNDLPGDIKMELLQHEIARRTVIKTDLSQRDRWT